MFLSRVSLTHPATSDPGLWWRMFENPYHFHQEVWALFGDGPARRRDFLYRLDREGREPRIFCLSEREPRAAHPAFRVESKRFAPVLRAGERLHFSLRANPVVSRQGARHDVVMDAKWDLKARGVPPSERPSVAQIAQERGTAWLLERAPKHGFAVEPTAVRVDRYEVLELTKTGGTRVRLGTCDFAGTLTVTDPEALLLALRQGIGPAKGFGCGLLLCKRAGS
jgi:CRISPR system Cascade subunit CasE